MDMRFRTAKLCGRLTAWGVMAKSNKSAIKATKAPKKNQAVLASAPVKSHLSELDVDTAWRRVKWDLQNRTFAAFAFEETLVDAGYLAWIKAIQSELADGSYSPRPCEGYVKFLNPAT